MPNMEDYKNEEEFDFAGYQIAFSEYRQAERIARFEKAVMEDYGIDADTWANTPEKIKSLIADLHQDAESHAETMYALEQWRDEMPI